jgi:hypothetical protein
MQFGGTANMSGEPAGPEKDQELVDAIAEWLRAEIVNKGLVDGVDEHHIELAADALALQPGMSIDLINDPERGIKIDDAVNALKGAGEVMEAGSAN